jgi:ABC-type transport system involved in multi-copper enzyme maturation permease subunit
VRGEGVPALRPIALVAGAVFRESVRDRVPYSMVVFAVLLIAASYLISQLTAGQDMKIIKDLGLAAIAIFGLAIAVFIGIGLVSKEVERRSVFALLAKPVSRGQFILGKYAGLVLTLAVNLSAMTVAFYAVLFYLDLTASETARLGWPAPALDPRLTMAVLLIVAELMLVTALALFFSTFSSPLLSAMMTLGFWVAGHFNADLRAFERVLDVPAAVYLARGLYYLIPNLAPFNIRAEVVHGVPVAWSHVGLTLAYAVVYIAILLLAAVAVFRRRDFK